MQNIIIFGIGALVCSLFLSNFIKLSSMLKGEDFNFKEYVSRFKLKNIDMKYAIIFFILFLIMLKPYDIINCLLIMPVFFSLILALIMDKKYMIIPNTCSIVILICGIMSLICDFSKEKLISSIIGLLVGGLTLFVIDFIFEKITHKEGFGYGDMKLLASIGMLLGYKDIIVIMILSVILSAIYSIVYIIINKLIKKIDEVYLPFGPFIVISTFILYVIPSSQIINWYVAFMNILVNKMI